MVKDALQIVVVDDYALIRESICEKLQRERGINVVATAGNADEAIERALEHRPDIVLMDIDMPGLLCFDAAWQITARLPETRIIFLSAFAHDAYVEQALQVKAAGYITKRESADTLITAIREVGKGRVYFSPDLAARIVVDDDGPRLASSATSERSGLTRREVEVLRYVARGMSKKQIAQTMHVSYKTVDSHTARLMAKLHMHSRVELTRFAIRQGLAEA